MSSQKQLFVAIKSGDVEQLQSMLDEAPELLNSRDEHGESPILTAVYYRQSDILGELIKRTPELSIWEAAATGHLLRVNELLDRDSALLNAFSLDGFTPLGLAAFFGRKAILDELIRRGADVNIHSNNAMRVMALHSAVAHRDIDRAIQMARSLLEKGAEVNAKQSGGFTALHEAALRGNIELTSLLLRWGADPSIKDDEGKSPIDIAGHAGHAEVVSLLRHPKQA